MNDFLQDFLKSKDTLRVYHGRELRFASGKDGLLPLLEYSALFPHEEVTVFDKIMGNAAALLSARAGCRQVYSPLGSRLALATFQRFDITYCITRIVPFIQKEGQQGMCPMEQLSIGKSPEEFYQAVLDMLRDKKIH